MSDQEDITELRKILAFSLQEATGTVADPKECLMVNLSVKKPISYRKLTVEVWKLGGAKFFLGGVGLILVTPIFLRSLKKLPIPNSHINDRLAVLRNKLNEYRESYQ